MLGNRLCREIVLQRVIVTVKWTREQDICAMHVFFDFGARKSPAGRILMETTYFFQEKSMEEEKIDPGHSGLRNVFRVLGPIVLLVGLLFVAIGMVSFFSSFGSFGPPRYFWCVFVGMPIMFVGLVLCKLGYMGKVARYIAGEIAPVGKDTFNYVAKGSQEGIKAVTSAIAGGLAAGGLGGKEITKVRCHKCNELVEEDSKFCDNCGQALTKTKSCLKCNELNDPDAKFCDNCGYNFP